MINIMLKRKLVLTMMNCIDVKLNLWIARTEDWTLKLSNYRMSSKLAYFTRDIQPAATITSHIPCFMDPTLSMVLLWDFKLRDDCFLYFSKHLKWIWEGGNVRCNILLYQERHSDHTCKQLGPFETFRRTTRHKTDLFSTAGNLVRCQEDSVVSEKPGGLGDHQEAVMEEDELGVQLALLLPLPENISQHTR